MAKRQTTGGPSKRRPSQDNLLRRDTYISRAERDRRLQRIATITIGVIAIFITLLVIGALIYDAFFVPDQELTTVNGEDVTVAEFRDRIQYERFRLAEQIRTFYNSAREEGGLSAEEARNQTFAVFSGNQETGQPGTIDLLINEEFLAQEILTTMEQERVLDQFAEAQGIEVDEETIDAEVAELMSNFTGAVAAETPTATPSPSPTLTRTPIVSPTPSSTPTETPAPSETPLPTVEGCAEDDDDCATTTPVPTNTITPTPTETQTPTATSTDLPIEQQRATISAFEEEFFEESTDISGLNEDAVRQTFYYRALTDAVRDFLTSDPEQFPEYYVPPDDIRVDARHILVGFPEDAPPPPDDEENEFFQEAQRIAEALRAGEPFAPLALAQSDDTTSAQQGGALGWASTSQYDEAFAEATETLPIGAISDPVRSQFGYHIIQVMGREQEPLTQSQLNQRRQTEYNEWLSERTITADIERREGWQDFIPASPDYNDLLADILPEFRNGTFDLDEDE
ncbi:MAG: peptidylprolyl isomerase [Anaerolineales bacterium]